MTSIVDKLKLPPDLDRRRKIPMELHAEIQRQYKNNEFSMRGLAKYYGVSKRLIQFIIYPERDKKLKERVKAEKRWLKYYDKNIHRETIRNTRAYKKS